MKKIILFGVVLITFFSFAIINFNCQNNDLPTQTKETLSQTNLSDETGNMFSKKYPGQSA